MASRCVPKDGGCSVVLASMTLGDIDLIGIPARSWLNLQKSESIVTMNAFPQVVAARRSMLKLVVSCASGQRPYIVRSMHSALLLSCINSQAKELGIERPRVRNGHSVKRLNTLTYILINIKALRRVSHINRSLLAWK